MGNHHLQTNPLQLLRHSRKKKDVYLFNDHYYNCHLFTLISNQLLLLILFAIIITVRSFVRRIIRSFQYV